MEKSYCTRCGRRLQEFQIILEMNKKNQARQTAEGEAVRELNHAQNNSTDGVSPVFLKSRKHFFDIYIYIYIYIYFYENFRTQTLCIASTIID